MQLLIERMPIETLPDTHHNAPTRSEDTAHLRERGMSVGEEHESELAEDQIEAVAREREPFSGTRTPFNGDAFCLSRSASHIDHVRAEIKADDGSARPHA